MRYRINRLSGALFFVLLCVIVVRESFSEDGVLDVVREAFELYSVGSYEDSSTLFEEAAHMLAERVPSDTEGLLKVCLYAGLSHRETGDYAKASIWFEKALSIAIKRDEKTLIPEILAYMGETERFLENYEKSAGFYRSALNTAVSDRDMAVLYYGLAESRRLSGRYDDAASACAESDKISKSAGLDKLYLSCRVVTGESYRMTGKYAESLQAFGVALDTARARNYPDIVVAALNGTGLVSETLGRRDAARDSFEEALQVSYKNGSFDGLILISEKISSLMPEKGGFSDKAAVAVAMAESEDLAKDPEIKAALYKLATDYYSVSGNFRQAAETSAKAYDESEAANVPAKSARALSDGAEAYYALGDFAEASRMADRALKYLKDRSLWDGIDGLYAIKAECGFKLGKYSEAMAFMAEAGKKASDAAAREKYAERAAEMSKYILTVKSAVSDKNEEPSPPAGTENEPYKTLRDDFTVGRADGRVNPKS